MKQIILTLLFILSVIASYSQETSYLCAGDPSPVFTSACSGGTGITYQWTKPNAVVVNASTVTADIAGTYTYVCTDVNGCTASGTHILVIEPNPTVTINASNTCTNTSQTVSATGVPVGYNYSWNFGSGASPATSTSSTANVTWSTTGSKTITLTITKGFVATTNGCDETCPWVYTKIITIGNLTGSSSCN